MRVVVAMSGGVDSSVVAGLLHEAGHEVVGVTLQLYDHGAAVGRKGSCCSGQDVHDARDVADRLGIAHYVLDAQQRFHETVVQPFADDYAAGLTPVPCVRCNQGVKFADLSTLARELGAEALATGHYARRVEGAAGPELHRAVDPARDQSWFLFATTREQLALARFPLGEMPDKAAVRAEASRLGLPVAQKPDSQDICFVPDGGYDALVGRLRPDAAAAGEVVDREGRVLGRHGGIGSFTVGQTRRLGAAASVGGVRQVVVALEPGRRRVVVGPREEAGERAVRLGETNWLVTPPGAPLPCAVRLRARDVLRPATIRAIGGGAEVVLDEPALAAPGQPCVAYDGGRVLGGGFVLPPAAGREAVDGGARGGYAPGPRMAV